MTQTLSSADIRGYYAALGIHLPGWASIEAAVRCFADPDAHRRDDCDPSCSVSLEHGAWHCHGCGAKGGAFDAATAKGHSDRAAMDLMVRYGLAERRSGQRNRPWMTTSVATTDRDRERRRVTTINLSEADVQHWRSVLSARAYLIERLTRDRAWGYETMRELELGFDHGRITIPVRDEHGRLAGLLRYQPWAGDGQAKMLAVSGSRRQLLPHPAAESARTVLLVEGEPDMIAARSRNLPAIALPGVDSWRHEWAPMLAGREVTIVMDADRHGRALAIRIARDLEEHAEAAILDLAPDRDDGYDLTDWLRENPSAADLSGAEVTTDGEPATHEGDQ